MASGGAAERATRLIALLPRLKRDGRFSLTDLSTELGVEPDIVVADLTLLSMCGVPPYSPDSLVDIEVDGDEVRVWSDPPAIESRLRLSANEARALVAATESSGIDIDTGSVRDALGGPEEDGLDDAVRTLLMPGHDARGVYACVAAALERSEAIDILYFTASRGETTERKVLPHKLANHGGEWYLHAFCTTVDAERTFRVDRIASCRQTGERFERPEYDDEGDPVLFDPEGLPVAQVRFDPGEADLDERTWPGATFEQLADGATLARIPFASPHWLARRVVARLGRAVVISPAELQETVRSLANSIHDAV